MKQDGNFSHGFLKNKDWNLAQSFNSNFRCIFDVLLLTNSRFGDNLHLLIYPNDIFESLLLVISVKCILTTKEAEKIKSTTNEMTPLFHLVNFPFFSNNIPATPAYDVYISQLILFSRSCVQYNDFQWVQLPPQKLLKQGYFFLCWSHLYKLSTVVITNWLPITKYPFFRW